MCGFSYPNDPLFGIKISDLKDFTPRDQNCKIEDFLIKKCQLQPNC